MDRPIHLLLMLVRATPLPTHTTGQDVPRDEARATEHEL